MNEINKYTIPNALPHVTIRFFKKEVHHHPSFEKMMVKRNNALKNAQLCTYFTKDVWEGIR